MHEFKQAELFYIFFLLKLRKLKCNLLIQINSHMDSIIYQVHVCQPFLFFLNQMKLEIIFNKSIFKYPHRNKKRFIQYFFVEIIFL